MTKMEGVMHKSCMSSLNVTDDLVPKDKKKKSGLATPRYHGAMD